MRKSIIAAIVTIGTLLALAGAAKPQEERDFTVSTTIDFLDYCFFDPETKDVGYLPLEVYEKRLREVAETGVKKLYLRVNVRGLTLYPTNVTRMYGEEGRFHWSSPKNAEKLINTLGKYDPCVETIRIGHKYGMEVWAWESLWEDGGLDWFIPRDQQYAELAKKYKFDAMNTPLFIEHPEYFAWRDPKQQESSLTGEELAEFNRKARELPITRIVMTDHVKGRKPLRIKAEDVRILVSDDNVTFKPYEGKFSFSSSKTPESFNRLELSDLNISAGFVKLSLARRFDTNAANVTMGTNKNQRRGQHLVYNSAGEVVPTVWTVDNPATGRIPEGTLTFNASTAEGWDYGQRNIGFAVGEIESARYYYGIAEYSVPEVMEHKLARFAELTSYPFDGFIFNLRSHATVPNPQEYGYNPENRAKYLERYGVDIWKEKADLRKLGEIRMESVAEFLRRCRAVTSGRPLYLSGWAPVDWTPPVGVKPISTPMYAMHMHLPIPYRQLLRDGAIDGVMMVGYDFSSYFTPEVTGSRPLRLGVFRELAHLSREKPIGADAKYDLKQDLEKLAAEPQLSEVELYETMIFNQNPEVREIVSGITGKAVASTEKSERE